jgi:hypothetical protein
MLKTSNNKLRHLNLTKIKTLKQVQQFVHLYELNKNSYYYTNYIKVRLNIRIVLKFVYLQSFNKLIWPFKLCLREIL